MGLGMKVLSGAGKVVWKLGTKDNLTPATGGGLTSAVITKQINAFGYGVLGAGTALAGMAKAGLEARNRRLTGQVTYQDGLTRMAGSHTTGAVESMMRSSKGDFEAFSGMAEGVLKSTDLGRLDDYGATPQMIAALYNMGGR